MTIVEIAEQIRAKKEQDIEISEEQDIFEWKPKECVDFTLPQFQIPDIRSKKYTNDRLSKVLAFIDLVKHKRIAHGCTIMPIACTNKRFMEICGGQKNASNLIQFMINIGLLEVENEYYQFNANHDRYNQSKQYKYYYDNERKIIEYCKENRIEKKIMKNNKYIHTVVEKFKMDDIDNDQVRFSSKLNLRKPTGFSKSEFEEYLTGMIYRNYPELAYYQSMADYINATYYVNDPSLEIHFTPNFTWTKNNKAVKKIGIRATNAFVSAKGEKDGNERFKGYYKEEVLKKYGLNLEKDVSSSVPRITLSLNMGMWISEETDIYKRIYDEYVERKVEKEGSSFKMGMPSFEKVRSSIKELHMRGYFDDENMIGVHVRYAMAEVKNSCEVDEEMRLFKEAIIMAEGGQLYGSEIFYHESCIYMEVLKELLDSGYKVWQCYDAWYAAKEGVTQEDFVRSVTELVKNKANEYIGRQNIQRGIAA